MRALPLLAALALAVPHAASAQIGEEDVLPQQSQIPPTAPGFEAPGIPGQAAIGCLGALRGIQTALERSDDAVLGLQPGERAVLESTVLAASDLAEQGREEICLRIAEAINPLVSEEPELAESRALGYAVAGIEWLDQIDTFVTLTELEGTDLWGQAEREGGDRAIPQVELGEVVGAVERFGQVTHLVIESEGVLGFGSETRAIPIGLVRWNLEEELLQTAMDEDNFADRAIVREERGLWILDEPVEGGRVRDVIGD